MDVLALANKLPAMVFGAKSDDDFSDRLNYRYTVALLILFSIVLTTRQYGSEVTEINQLLLRRSFNVPFPFAFNFRLNLRSIGLKITGAMRDSNGTQTCTKVKRKWNVNVERTAEQHFINSSMID
jgi:hypothetical protein